LKDAINSLGRDANDKLKEKVALRKLKTIVDPINNTLKEVTEALKSLPGESGVRNVLTAVGRIPIETRMLQLFGH